MSGTAKTAFAKRRLTVFFVVTFALTWGVQIPAALALGAFENGELATPVIVPVVAVSMFFPFVGALVANRACGVGGKIDLGFHPHIRENVRSYLAAWFMPTAVAVVGYLVFFVANPQLFDPSLSGYMGTLEQALGAAEGSVATNVPSGEELERMAPLFVAATLFAALTFAPFVNAIPAFGEEAGWRGLLFPTLCELMPVRAAVVVSGVIWGLWHAPVIAMGHNYGMGYAGFPWTGMMVMTLACTAMGSCLAYLRLRTESVWPCALAHGAFNAIANTGVVFCSAGQTLAGPSPLGFIAGIPLIILGILCFVRVPATTESVRLHG